jgi:hypothetical protein
MAQHGYFVRITVVTVTPMRWITEAIAELEARGERLPAGLDCEGTSCGYGYSLSGCLVYQSNSYTVRRPTFWPTGDAKIKSDWISGLLIVLLIVTLWAFFSGAFPYPYGWIVLLALLVMRLTATQKNE